MVTVVLGIWAVEIRNVDVHQSRSSAAHSEPTILIALFKIKYFT